MNETLCIGDATLTVRPIEITDVERLEGMFGRLSPESVRFRFFSPTPRRAPTPDTTVHFSGGEYEARIPLTAGSLANTF